MHLKTQSFFQFISIFTAVTIISSSTALAGDVPAKNLFGFKSQPAPLAARAIGSYARGCLAGGEAVQITGRYWQVMRLSRNRNWGHPALIRYVKRLANEAGEAGEWNGLMVGDLAQPRGGPMLSGHASHQIGLDADIWLNEMPDRTLSRKEREKLSAVSVVNFKKKQVNRSVWTDRHLALIKRAASYKEVARIFVNPIIKKELCTAAGSDRKWLRKVRPWRGHHYHMHVRLACPRGSKECKDQPKPAVGDGCGEDLARWFRPPPKTKKPVKRKPKQPITLASLPGSCRVVLKAGKRALPVSSTKPPLPKKKP